MRLPRVGSKPIRNDTVLSKGPHPPAPTAGNIAGAGPIDALVAGNPSTTIRVQGIEIKTNGCKDKAVQGAIRICKMLSQRPDIVARLEAAKVTFVIVPLGPVDILAQTRNAGVFVIG